MDSAFEQLSRARCVNRARTYCTSFLKEGFAALGNSAPQVDPALVAETGHESNKRRILPKLMCGAGVLSQRFWRMNVDHHMLQPADERGGVSFDAFS